MFTRIIEKITATEKAANNKLAILGFSFLVALAIAAGAMLYALNKL